MIYFDNAATTPVSEEVLDSFNKVVTKYFANPASNHKLGQVSADLEKKAREQIAKLFYVEESEVIFTSGATESNNLAIKGASFKYKNRGNHIITTNVEHPSVLNAFAQLEEQFGFKVTYLPVSQEGTVSVNQVEEALQDDTILVSIMSVNNEIGAINDVDAIGKMLKKYPKIIFHVDATQSIGKIDISLKNIDMMSMSAHKINGFKGSGILIKKKNIDLLPLSSGGGQEQNIRSGTNNFPYEVCISKAIRIALENREKHYQYVEELNRYLREKILKIEGVSINSPQNASPYILNFSIKKKASVITEGLSNEEIYVSTKSACSSKHSPYSYVIKAIGKSDDEATNAIRISLSYKNTKDEIDIFYLKLKNLLQTIK
ncbi:MAG: cysteine desulfurase family protein [Bacilli bacterium]